MKSGQFTCFEVQSLTEENLRRVIAYAKRFGVTSIGYMAADWKKWQILDHSEWDVPPPDEEARLFTQSYQEVVRRGSEIVSDAGLDFYLWRREARLPAGFVERYGADWINSGNPELWKFVAWNLESIFKLFPKVAGLFLTCTGEQTPNEWISANGMAGNDPLEVRFAKMFRVAADTCARHGRDLILRTHGIADEARKLVPDPDGYLESFLRAVRRIGVDQKVMGKSVEPDYQAGYPFNGIMGRLAGQQPTLMEFSLPMEYNGVSRTPFPMVEDILFRMRYAAELGCAGIVARIDWHMTGHQADHTWSCLDTPNEINAYAFGRLIKERGLTSGEIRRDYVRERYGDAAGAAMDGIYRDLFSAGMKKYYEFGHRASYTPSGAFLPPWRTVSLLRYQAPHFWSHSAIDFINCQAALEPDKSYLTALDAEKREAETIYRDALQKVNESAGLLSPADLRQWQEGLERALEESVIRRYLCLAFYAWLAFERLGERDWSDFVEEQLARVTPLIDEFVKRYDPLDLDPDNGDVFGYGANSRTTLAGLRNALVDTREYWANCAVSASEKRSVCSRYEPDAFDLAASDSIVRINPVTFRLQLLSGAGLGSPFFTGDPLTHFLIGGLSIDETRISFSGHRLQRLDNGAVRLELITQFHNLRLSFTTREAYPAVLVDLRLDNLPEGSRMILPWIAGEPAEDGLADPVLGRAGEAFGVPIAGRRATLKTEARPLFAVDLTPDESASSKTLVEESWAWSGEGTVRATVLLAWE